MGGGSLPESRRSQSEAAEEERRHAALLVYSSRLQVRVEGGVGGVKKKD